MTPLTRDEILEGKKLWEQDQTPNSTSGDTRRLLDWLEAHSGNLLQMALDSLPKEETTMKEDAQIAAEAHLNDVLRQKPTTEKACCGNCKNSEELSKSMYFGWYCHRFDKSVRVMAGADCPSHERKNDNT